MVLVAEVWRGCAPRCPHRCRCRAEGDCNFTGERKSAEGTPEAFVVARAIAGGDAGRAADLCKALSSLASAQIDGVIGPGSGLDREEGEGEGREGSSSRSGGASKSNSEKSVEEARAAVSLQGSPESSMNLALFHAFAQRGEKQAELAAAVFAEQWRSRWNLRSTPFWQREGSSHWRELLQVAFADHERVELDLT